MDMTAERDAEIGQEICLLLHRMLERLAMEHQLPVDQIVGYLIAGTLVVAADRYELTIDETLEVVDGIARHVKDDDLPGAARP